MSVALYPVALCWVCISLHTCTNWHAFLEPHDCAKLINRNKVCLCIVFIVMLSQRSCICTARCVLFCTQHILTAVCVNRLDPAGFIALPHSLKCDYFIAHHIKSFFRSSVIRLQPFQFLLAILLSRCLKN